MKTNQLSLKKQLIDQSAHALASLTLLALLVACPAWWSAMLAGAGYGVVREISEGASHVNWAKIKNAFDPWSCLDVLFWSLGGLAAWLLFS